MKENACSNDEFTLIKENDYYKIRSVENTNYYLANSNNNLILRDNYNLFELLENENGSYNIKLKDEYLFVTPYNDTLTLKEPEENQEFYLEESDLELFVENKATYTEDGKFITSMTDTLGNTTTYNIDPNTGLTDNVTDPKGNTTMYTYNAKHQITEVAKGSKSVNYTYNNQNLLDKIINGTKEYKFNYDEFLNIQNIKINNNTLITNNYENNNGNLTSSVYGNNDIISYVYDEYDRVTKTIKEDDTYNYKYDNLGNVSKIITNSHKYNYYYDLAKRLTQYKYDDFTIRYGYQANNLKEQYYNLNNLSKHIEYDYNKEDVVSKITLDNNKIDYTYDNLGRLKDKVLNDTYKTEYEYITNGKKTSFILKSIKNGNTKYRYTYDKLGNITNIYLNEELINSFTYDSDNELITDIDHIRNIKTEYTYDNIGNILSKKEYSLIDNALLNENTYEYNNTNWEDQLTKFNDEQITYDPIGNPLRVGENELTWINGRQLQSYKNDDLLVEYKYNKDGIRTSKRANGEQILYYLENNNIIYEQRANSMIYYIRDGIGDLVGLEYNGSIYYYLKNAQNDIISILDSSYSSIVNYTYDAYGNILSITDNLGNDISSDNTHIASINPFRYRSYYYDKETGLYYLNSRYYNPEIGRFFNPDRVLQGNKDIFGYNLYVYVSNNPITYSDPSGRFKLPSWRDIVNAVKVVVKVVSVVAKVVSSVLKASSDIVKNEVKNSVTIEYGNGNGYGTSVQTPIGKVGGTNVTTKNTTTIKPFQDQPVTYLFSSERTISLGIFGVTQKFPESENSKTEYTAGPVDISNETIFIGAGGDLYVPGLIGVHGKIGLEFDNTTLTYQGLKAIYKGACGSLCEGW